ncbi:MAG: transporter [Vicinamibacteria bacterium]|nr:transporter [Vicinamibacteria bacterium]
MIASAAFPCGNANCPLVTQSQDSVKSKGVWSLDFGYRFMRQNGLVGAGPGDSRPAAPLIDFERQIVLTGHHSDVSMRHSLLQVDVGYGVSSRVTFNLSLPLLTDRAHEQFDLQGNVGTSHNLHGPSNAAGGEAGLASSPTSHGGKGVGDLQVGAALAAFTTSRHSLVVRLGVKAPTGEHKVRDSFGSIDRPDLQPGSGSWDAVGAAQYQRRIRDSEWSASLGAWGGVNGTNDLHYHFGNQISLAAGVVRATPGRLRLSAQVGFHASARDTYLANAVPATGLRTWTFTPGARMRLSPGVGAYMFAKIPVATRVNDAQLKPRVDILAGFSQTF